MKTSLITAVIAACSVAMLPAQTPPPAPIIKVTLLGTGVPLLNAVALASGGRALSGLLVEAGTERMLFDCGQGVYSRLVQSGGASPLLYPNVGVDKVFLSHLHSDHMADLAPLYALGALYRYTDPINGAAADNPLKVFGPSGSSTQPVGIYAAMQSFHIAYETDFYTRQLFTNPNDFTLFDSAVETQYNTVELWPDVVYKKNGVTVTAFAVDHHPLNPAYGFRVDYQGHSFVYSGDTAPTANIVTMSKGVDLLVHEIYGYPRAAAPEIYDYHTSPEDAAVEFTAAAPKQVVFTHIALQPMTTANDLVARTKAAGYTGPLMAGADLMVINIGASGVTIVPPAGGMAINDEPATSDFIEVYRSKMRQAAHSNNN